MRAFQTLPAAAISAFVILAQLRPGAAKPVALEDSQIEKRCDNPCGYHGWLCCRSDQTCGITNNDEAICLNGGTGGRGGHWEYFTTTYLVTETDVSTITSVWSRHVAGPAPTGSCQPALGETPCGGDCCDADSVCVNNECVVGSSSSAGVTATETGTTTETGTGAEQPTPPVRGTSNGVSLVTETAAPTTTQGFIAPVGSDGATMIGVHASSGGAALSGGEIAGIVIGVIAGIFVLFLFCACLCCRGIIDCLLGIFGCGHRRGRESTTYVDRHSRHSHSHRPEGRTWFGTRPPRSDDSEKRSGMGFWAKAAIAVGAIALCLGLKRHRDHEEDRSDYTYPSSYYYYSDYYTSPSSSSSDRRTRRTRDSRRSRSSRRR